MSGAETARRQIVHSSVSTLLPLAHNIAQGFNQPCPPLRTLTMASDLTKAFDMVNHTKLISTVILSPLSNNTKRWVSPYLKEHAASCLYNFTLSPSFHVRVGVPQSACKSHTLFNISASTFRQSGNLLTNSYENIFTFSCLFQLQLKMAGSEKMSGVWPYFLLQNPISLIEPLNSGNLTLILKSL